MFATEAGFALDLTKFGSLGTRFVSVFHGFASSILYKCRLRLFDLLKTHLNGYRRRYILNVSLVDASERTQAGERYFYVVLLFLSAEFPHEIARPLVARSTCDLDPSLRGG